MRFQVSFISTFGFVFVIRNAQENFFFVLADGQVIHLNRTPKKREKEREEGNGPFFPSKMYVDSNSRGSTRY